MDDEQQLVADINASARELLATAFDGLVIARGEDQAVSAFVIEAVKAMLDKDICHCCVAEQLIFQLIDIIRTSDHMNYPTVAEDIAKDITTGLEAKPSNVVRLH